MSTRLAILDQRTRSLSPRGILITVTAPCLLAGKALFFDGSYTVSAAGRDGFSRECDNLSRLMMHPCFAGVLAVSGGFNIWCWPIHRDPRLIAL